MSTNWLNISLATCGLTLRYDENEITMSKRRYSANKKRRYMNKMRAEGKYCDLKD